MLPAETPARITPDSHAARMAGLTPCRSHRANRLATEPPPTHTRSLPPSRLDRVGRRLGEQLELGDVAAGGVEGLVEEGVVPDVVAAGGQHQADPRPVWPGRGPGPREASGPPAPTVGPGRGGTRPRWPECDLDGNPVKLAGGTGRQPPCGPESRAWPGGRPSDRIGKMSGVPPGRIDVRPVVVGGHQGPAVGGRQCVAVDVAERWFDLADNRPGDLPVLVERGDASRSRRRGPSGSR